MFDIILLMYNAHANQNRKYEQMLREYGFGVLSSKQIIKIVIYLYYIILPTKMIILVADDKNDHNCFLWG